MSRSLPFDVETDPAAAAVARAELRIAVLQELTQIGMRLARKLEEATAEGEASPAPDPVEAFARISRAIRLTVTLEGKADEALHDLRAGIVVQQKERAAVPWSEDEPGFMTDLDRERHKKRVRELAIEAIETETPDRERRAEITAALDERLDKDMAYQGMYKWPLREIIEHLCVDLCLAPNWKRWNNDAWGHERFWRPPTAPYQQPRQTPYWFDNATPTERRKRLGLE